jgi:hypothetical protein
MSVDNARLPAVVGELGDRAPAAGKPGGADQTCVVCGYGISARAVLPRCPMCGAADWRAARPVTAPGGPPRHGR